MQLVADAVGHSVLHCQPPAALGVCIFCGRHMACKTGILLDTSVFGLDHIFANDGSTFCAAQCVDLLAIGLSINAVACTPCCDTCMKDQKLAGSSVSKSRLPGGRGVCEVSVAFLCVLISPRLGNK